MTTTTLHPPTAVPATGVLASLALATLLPSLAVSSANVALPTLAAELHAPFADVQWVTLAYLLATTLEAERDMSYYTENESRVQELTIDDVNRALRRWIDPVRLSLVEAGDFEKVNRESTGGPNGGR